MQKIFSLIIASIFAILFIYLSSRHHLTHNKVITINPVLPDFSQITDTEERKQAFINFLEPSITAVESDICQARYYIKKDQKTFWETGQISYNEQIRLNIILRKYNIVPDDALSASVFEQILLQLNIIPRSLLLSQAALETNWGTSRFSKYALNFFGQHCYESNCGIPALGAKSVQIKKFSTAKDSIESYVTILNTSPRFAVFRQVRDALWVDGGKISTTPQLLNSFGDYAEIDKNEYVSRLIAIIKNNNLQMYDNYSCED